MVTGFDGSNLIDDIHAFDDVTESGILAIKEEVILIADEELGTCAIRIHGTGHRDDATLMGELVVDAVRAEFAFDGISWATGAVA